MQGTMPMPLSFDNTRRWQKEEMALKVKTEARD